MSYPLPQNIVAEVRLPHSHIILRSDRVAEIRCANEFTYEVDDIKENHRFLKEFANGSKIVVISHTGRYTLISSEARLYVAQGYQKDFIAAEAVLIHSLPQRLAARFFLRLDKPLVPAQYFKNEQKSEAEAWLLSHL